MAGSGLVQQCTALLAFCRVHFYKIVAVIVLAFLLMQYATNVLVNNHSMPKTVNPGLSWVSSFSVHRILGVGKEVTRSQQPGSTTVPPYVKLKSSNETIGPVRVLSLQANGTNRTSSVTPPTIELNHSISSYNNSTKVLTLCPVVPPKLVGRLKVLLSSPSFEELEKIHQDLEPGGLFHPTGCTARSKVAIIIPYRDREEHLRIFLHNLHPMLQRQQLDYGIYVVEEMGSTKFNRAMLMNIGYVEALKQYEYQCFMFHDVDLIPEDDRNLYTCPEQPRHMSVAINSFGYRLPYKDLFGGVSALRRKHMEKVNGFSNEFWGWGGEDDDMSNRLRYHGLQITRYPASIARYTMLKHSKDEPNPDRYNKLYKGRKRFKTDGLNSLKYKRTDLVLKKLYTLVQVEIHPPTA